MAVTTLSESTGKGYHTIDNFYECRYCDECGSFQLRHEGDLTPWRYRATHVLIPVSVLSLVAACLTLVAAQAWKVIGIVILTFAISFVLTRPPPTMRKAT